jgi:hypothetical protein
MKNVIKLNQSFFFGYDFVKEDVVIDDIKYTTTPLPSSSIVGGGKLPRFTKKGWINDDSAEAKKILSELMPKIGT